MPYTFPSERPKKAWYWIKHHFITVCILGITVVIIISFLWGKSSVIIMDSSGPKTYKAGIKVLTQVEIPDPNYVHSSPQLITLICADGTKLVMTQMTATVIGECP